MGNTNFTGVLEHIPTPAVGDFVEPDGWRMGGVLLKGDSFSPIRIETANPIVKSLAVRIDITSRSLKIRPGRDGFWARCRVVFLGDCEPDTTAGGWVKFNGNVENR